MILVTGATGFIGQSLIQALHSQDRPVKPYTGKLNDALALPAELLDVDSVIHLAGAETHGRVRLLKRVDIEGTERLLAEAGQAGVKKIIPYIRCCGPRATSSAGFAIAICLTPSSARARYSAGAIVFSTSSPAWPPGPGPSSACPAPAK